MLRQVKLFTTTKAWDLERMINEFLTEHKEYSIRNIEYNCLLHPSKDQYDEALTEYSALVIYSVYESLDEKLYPAGKTI
jgi:hypothetical protein